MRIREHITTERAALATLAVFLLVTFALLWHWNHANDDAAKHADDSFGGRNYGAVDPKKSMSQTWSDENAWQARAGFKPGSSTIEVDLRHRDLEQYGQMKVHANFKSAWGGALGANWLTRDSDGIYRSPGVDLPKGQYTLGLTGYDRSRLTFRLETTLVVE